MSARFQLALERISSSDWRRFEILASAFLVGEFPGLRTMATPSGDGGRDGEIFVPDEDLDHVLQFSVTTDFKTKLIDTAKTISVNFPEATLLTYVTNQQIGALADAIKKRIRKEFRLYVDVRDISYFLDRENLSDSTRIASEELSRDFVDPLLRSRGLMGTASVLNGDELRAAHVFLSLQLRDDTQEKGLTKTAFDALVRSVLIGTNPQERLNKSIIEARILNMLPGTSVERIGQLVESALHRLHKKKSLGRFPNDEYCLSFSEAQALSEHLATQALTEEHLSREIEQIVSSVEGIKESSVPPLAVRVRRILENALYSRAEAFAEAITSGKVKGFALDALSEQVSTDLRSFPIKTKGDLEGNPAVLKGIVGQVLSSSAEIIQKHLHYLSDAYTLLAFLRATPDVQSAMEKVFSYGEVWLDTTLLLPLIAEELLPDGSGKLQRMVSLAIDAGLTFNTTRGVVQELSTHMNRALAYNRTLSSRWEGSIPFLYQIFVQTGRSAGEFESWIDEFRGFSRPEEDLISFLQARFGISVVDLLDELGKVEPTLRYAVDEYWIQVHESRRERHSKSERALDPATITRLAKHDTESYLGVIQRREKDGNSPLGYSAWWLTFDRYALGVEKAIRKDAGVGIPSPVMSIDFLNQYLSLGPSRNKLPKGSVQALPMLIEPRMMAFLSTELIVEARKIREAMHGATEWKIQRQVRDRLNDERRKRGEYAEAGMNTFIDEMGDTIPLPKENLDASHIDVQ